MIQFLLNVPPSLKQKVTDHVFEIMLPKNDILLQLFQTFPDDLVHCEFNKDILQMMTIKFVPPEEVLIA